MSPEEIRQAIAEQRAMVDAALGGMRIPSSIESMLDRTLQRLAQQYQEEQPDERTE